jgi:hypothetical protein
MQCALCDRPIHGTVPLGTMCARCRDDFILDGRVRHREGTLELVIVILAVFLIGLGTCGLTNWLR